MLKRRKMSSILCLLIICSTLAMFSAPSISHATDKDATIIRTEVNDEMLAGRVYPVAVTVQNTGMDTWSYFNAYNLASLATNDFTWSQWKYGGVSTSVINQRVYLPQTLSVLSGEGAPFNFFIQAPTSPGSYDLSMQMVQDGVTFFGQQYSKSIEVKNIVVDGLPKKLKANSTYLVTVSVINNGVSTWTSSNDYELQRLDSNFVWSNWKNGGTSSTALLSSLDSIESNQGTSFSFDILTPSAAGTYTFSTQVKRLGGGASDTYTKDFEIVSSTGIYTKEGEDLFDIKTGSKSSESASGREYGYSQGSGNTAMWKSGNSYSAYVDSEGEYNIWLRVMSSKVVPLRIQMYGGPDSGIFADFTPSDINSWQWIGPLKVEFQSGYNDYQLTLWKIGGDSNDFVAVDKSYFVSTDEDNSFAKKLDIDQTTISYLIPQTANDIQVNANDSFPVFYKVTGMGDSIFEIQQEHNHSNHAALRSSMNAGVIRIKIEYLGQPASGLAKFRFTNLSDSYDGKAADTIIKATGYGRIAFDHGSFFNPVLLDDDLLPGQSFEAVFKSDWLTDSNGNYVVKIYQKKHEIETIGTFTVAPGSMNESTVVISDSRKIKLEGETALVNKSGTGADELSSNGEYAYVNGGGNTATYTGMQNSAYFTNSDGLYHIYARVRASNHTAHIRLQLYGSDSSVPFIDSYLSGNDEEWTWIGPLNVNINSSNTYNLAIWNLIGQPSDRLEVDCVEFIRYDYNSVLSCDTSVPVSGAEEAYKRNSGLQNEWKMIEVNQPPKDTDLYLKLLDSKQMETKREALDVVLGSNLTSTRGSTIYDWTIGDEDVFMSWYYPYRQKDIFEDWQSKITDDLDRIAANGYNVILLQLFPQFMYSGSPMEYTLSECNRLNIKVLPSIYYLNQAEYLMDSTGITFRTADQGGYFADATDPEFSRALAAWFELLYSEYSDIFYVNADNKIPVLYGEEHGYGVPQGWPHGSRMAPGNIENMREFRDWLMDKYVTNTAWNTAWGYSSNYPAFDATDTIPDLLLDELTNTSNPTWVIGLQPQYYAEKWREGGTAIADFDAFRSDSIKTRWLDTRNRILSNYPGILFGVFTFGQYGLEDDYGSKYKYSEFRPGVLGDDLADYTDFVVSFYYNVKEIESAVDYWHSKGNDVIVYIRESGGVTDIYGNSPQKLSDGAYSDINGLYGMIYDNSYPLYSALKSAYKLGAIPGVYAWNDYPLWNIAGAAMREDIGIFRDQIINP